MSKLKTLFNYLADGKEKTSLEIQRAVNTVCSGSRVADLRKKGCDIKSRYIKRTDGGAAVHGYTMISLPAKLLEW